MAWDSLSNSSSKLNLTRRQVAVFQKILLVGNDMADEIRDLDKQSLLPNGTVKLAEHWGDLMVELVKMLF